MFGPLSSFRMTTSPALPARAVVAATGTRQGPEVKRAVGIARANGASLHVVKLGSREHALAVSDVAEDIAARLVVVGFRGDGSRAPFAEDVHDAAGRPILQVRNAADRPYHRVCIAIDTTSAVREMIEAARFVAPYARRVELLHAYRSPEETALISQGMGFVAIRNHRREAERVARERLAEVLERARVDLDMIELRLVHGSPRLVLSAVPSDALLVVHRGRSWFRHAVFGSVTRAVLISARSDVLVV